VEVKRVPVKLTEMLAGIPADEERFGQVLTTLLSGTPLTDLAWVDRDAPPFVWTRNTLAVVATVAGCNLALRAFSQREAAAETWARHCGSWARKGLAALEKSTAQLAQGSTAQQVAQNFVTHFRAAVAQWTAKPRTGRELVARNSAA